MSNRLTFSLASLIFLIALGLVFVPTSVMADNDAYTGVNHGTDGHDNQGDANSDESSTPTHQHPKFNAAPIDADTTRAGIQVQDKGADTEPANTRTATIEFDVSITLPANSQANGSAVDSSTFDNVAALPKMSDGSLLPTSTSAFGTWASASGGWKSTLTITFNFADDNDADTTINQERATLMSGFMDKLQVDLAVPSNMIQITGTGKSGATADQGNLPSTTTATLVGSINRAPALNITTSAPTSAKGVFNVSYTATDADSDTVTVTGEVEEVVDPTATDSTTTATTTYTIAKSGNSFRITQKVKTGTMATPSATVRLTLTATDGNATVMDSIDIPFAAAQNPPTVDIMISAVNTTARTFRIAATFTPETDGDGDAGAAIPVSALNAFHNSLNAKDAGGFDAVITLPNAADRRAANNRYDAILAYNNLVSLPLTITVDPMWDIDGSGSGIVKGIKNSTDTWMVGSSVTDTINIPTATSSSAPINVGSHFDDTMIPGFGYAVLVRDFDGSGLYQPTTWLRSNNAALPDLAWFFGGDGGPNTGTIALRKTAGTTAVKDLIISEIMWGTDSSLAMPAGSQWIEFYNTTPNAIDLSQFTITFHRSLAFPNTAGAIDVVSNVGHVYFGQSEFPGSSGRSTAVDSQNRFADPMNLVSMRRVINHTRVEEQNIKNRGERNKGIGGWAASVYPTANVEPYHVATPGADQLIRTRLGNSSPSQRVIINEIGNSSNDANDWLELHNTTGGGVSIENWELMRVTARSGGGGIETFIARFPKVTIPANSYVVITNTHPRNEGNDLAAGIDLAKGDADQLNRGLGSKPDSKTAYYLVDSELKFANNSDRCLYILRHAHDREGQPTHIEDVVGTLSLTLRGPSTDKYTWYSANDLRIWDTAMWPLQGRGGAHGDVITDGPPEHFGPGWVYQRNGKNSGTGEHHLSRRDYTGIGYDRMAANNNENGGTPGYSNGSLKGDKSNWAGQVSFSEIMLVTHTDAAEGRVPRALRLPQWLELYNSSMTEGVNINQWYLEIQNADTPDLDTRDLHGTLRLPNMTIPPNQTILITTSAGLNSGHFPEQRVINLFLNGTYRNILTISARGDSVLSQVGFYIALRDHKGNHVDEIGNLNVRSTNRRPGTETRDVSNFNTRWDFPKMLTEDGHRTSLIRIYNNGNPSDGLNQVADGNLAEADRGNVGWVLASNTSFKRVPTLTYYGNHQDYGTPGYRGGGPLPVSLSTFRPQRLDDGSVVIRWVTESETNNAGFNILRSDTRDGEFTKLNTQLIAGQGTTSERTGYEFTDKSAKPNVVHYYQIQDVSIDGNITTLQTTHLRGHVSAAGKLTTTWGGLKALQ